MYQSEKPYPSIEVEKKNIAYAKLLLEDYAGINSEDTAIHQYLYQAIVLNNKELYDVLLRISEVEMHHLDILGKLISKLGLKPVFGIIDKEQFIPWTAFNVNYKTDEKIILKMNILHEKVAIENYLKHIKLIDDKYIKNILKRIIEDEIVHIEIFNDMLKKLEKLN